MPNRRERQQGSRGASKSLEHWWRGEQITAAKLNESIDQINFNSYFQTGGPGGIANSAGVFDSDHRFETCIKAGWIDSPLDEFGRVQMTVAEHHPGANFHTPVRVATTAAGTLATDFESGDTVDGVVLATGDRILIKDQTAGTENGAYVVQSSGAPVRAGDAVTGTAVGGFAWFVKEGDDNAGDSFIVTNASGSDVIDTDAIEFDDFNETWCETAEQVWVVDFVGLGDTLEKNTGILAMPLCNSTLHAVVSAPCELKETRPLSMSGDPAGCMLLSEVGDGSLTISG